MNTDAQKISPEDDELLSQLYSSYHSRIHRYVYAYIKDESIANDIVSDVFILACEKFDEFKNHPNQIGWLYQAAKNKIRQFYRRLQKDPMAFHEEIKDDDEASPLHKFSPYGNSLYSLKELEVSLHDSLRPDEYKRFLRYFIWGYSIQEIADLEGVSYENMSVRLSRLRQKLKDQL